MELCIAIALIAIITTLVVVGIQSGLEGSRSVKCVGNLRQISFGLTEYILDHNGHLVPGAVVKNSKNLYWYHALEPYMGDSNLDPNSPNRPKWQQCPSKIISPLTRETVGYGWNYNQFGYYDSPNEYELGPYGWGSRLIEVTKPAHTIILGDSKDAHVNPASNFEHRYIYTWGLPATPDKKLARRHRGRGNYLFLDGHVEGLSPEELGMDHKIFLKIQ